MKTRKDRSETSRDAYVQDLHGYHVSQGVNVADQVIRHAWESGCNSVTLIHGAKDVESREQAQADGRGGIKFELRDRLSSGEWSAYVQPPETTQHVVGDKSLTLQLRPNDGVSKKDRPSKVRLPKPMKSSHFKASSAYNAARQEVDEEHPVLNAAEGQCPELVRSCRRALATERVVAERLEHKRMHNPDYSKSHAYARLLRQWQKAQAKAEEKLREIQYHLTHG